MRRLLFIASALGLIVVMEPGCYRTRYVNFIEPGYVQPADVAPAPADPPSRWQHFFVWGWFPIERRIDAAAACGGRENVAAIETRQTFLQGLIAAVAGYYVNIYSPYTGGVVCEPP